MYDSNSRGVSYGAGFFILIGLALAGIFIGTLISIPIWTSMTGKSLLAMKDELGNPAYSNAFKLMQAVSTLFGFLLPSIITAAILNRKPYQLLGYTRRITGWQIVLVIFIMLTGLYASGAFGYLNQMIPIPSSWKTVFQKMEDDYNKQVTAIMQLRTAGDYLLGLLIMAFLPALCEETLFRGGLQNFLTRSTKNPWFSILVVSILFSAVHFSFYGFLPRLVLGVVLGLIYHYTGSLWLCILAHFSNNAMAVTQYYYNSDQVIKEMTQNKPPLSLVYVGLLAIPVMIVLLVILKRISKQPEEAKFSFEDVRDKAPWEIND